MSPAKPKKAAPARKPAGKARAGKAARPKPKARPQAKGAKAAKKAAPARPAAGHAHCAATDPFGDACQNLPRRPSRYCVIHSYLDR